MRFLRALFFSSCCVLSACASFPSRTDHHTQASRAMNGVAMDYAVYLPPNFSAREQLPLIVFLHGGGDGADAFDRFGISERLDREIAARRVPRAVIVLPDGDLGFWMNWYDGTRRYEDWIIDELVPLVREEYHTASCPEHCHVMGVSMGGNGALRFAFHRPDRFSTVTAISGPVMNTQQMIRFITDPLYGMLIPMHRIFGPPAPRSRIEAEDLYRRWTSPDSTQLSRIVLAWGRSDRGEVIAGSRAFHRHLERHHIPHEAWDYRGGHGWHDWTPIILRAIRTQLAPREG